MFNEKRPMLYHNYIRALDYFTNNPDLLIELERYVTELVNWEIVENYPEIECVHR